MAAHEHHPQLVIVHCRLARRRIGQPLQVGRDLVRAVPERRVAAQDVERAVARNAEQPAAGIVGHAGIRPLLQRLDERILHDFFSEIEVGGTEDTGQPGDHLSRAAAEQMVDEVMRSV